MIEVIKIIAFFLSMSSYSGETIPRSDIYCMAHAIHHEARGEDLMGQIAVGHVITNRVASSKYPNEVCEVVYQPKQFSGLYPDTPIRDKEYWPNSILTAIFVWTGYVNDPTNGATHYYAASGKQGIKDPWPCMEKLASIGNHDFKQERTK